MLRANMLAPITRNVDVCQQGLIKPDERVVTNADDKLV